MRPESGIEFNLRSARLAKRARAGDRSAFEQLLVLWHPRLLAFARRKAGADADDVLQSASLTLSQSLHRLADPTRFGPFALTIIARRAAAVKPWRPNPLFRHPIRSSSSRCARRCPPSPRTPAPC